MTIRTALLRWFLVLGLVPMLLASSWSYFNTKDGLEAVIKEGLLKQIESQTTFIENWFHYRVSDAELLADSPITLKLLRELSGGLEQSGRPLAGFIGSYDWQTSVTANRAYFDKQWVTFDYLYDMFVIDKQGNILFTVAGEADLGTNLFDGEYASSALGDVFQRAFSQGKTLFSEFGIYSASSPHVFGFAATPIIDEDGRKAGVFAIQFNLHRIEELLRETSVHGGQNYVVNSNHQYQIHSDINVQFSNVKHTPPAENEQMFSNGDVRVFNTHDTSNENIIAVHKPIKVNNLNWTLINETKTDVAFASLEQIIKAQILFVLLTAVAVFFFAKRQAKALSQPIAQLTSSFQKPFDELQEKDFDVDARYEVVNLVQALKELWGKSRDFRKVLQHNLRLQEAILNNLGAALVMIDAKGIIKRFTPSAEQIFGYKEAEMLGQNVKSLMPDDIARRHDDILKSYRPGKDSIVIGQNLTLKGKRKNGELFDLDLIVTAVELDNNRLFVGLINDVTERVNSHKALMDALSKADAANKAKSEFLANMSHEIRTPMNAIYGTLQLLDKSNGLPDNLTNLVGKARLSSHSLLTIINDILDFSKIEAGMLTLEEQPFDIHKVVQLVVSDLNPVAKHKGLSLDVVIESDCHRYWIGDLVRVKQILLNLTSNAVKFTQQGSVRLSVTCDEKTAPGLNLVIEDSGIGMDKSTVDKLFERFEQADNSTTRKYGGTGLGMSITYSLVMMMDGTIDVSSEEGKGSRFEIWLPLSRAEETETKPKKAPPSAPDLSGHRILLAEDNEINQMVFESIMEKTGAALTIAANGEDAVAACKDTPPDLVFMDIQMPVMDGIDACIQIKKQYPDLPIIALTANVMDEDVKKYEESGFDDFIGKPIEIDDLYRLLKDRFS